MAAVVAAMLSILWTAIARNNDFTQTGAFFFLTVACCWAVLVPAKLWPNPKDDSWTRRVFMMGLGLGVGAVAIWLDGRELSSLVTRGSRSLVAEEAHVAPGGGEDWRNGNPPMMPGMTRGFRSSLNIPVAACYLSYFGLAFFALRWWRMADRRRAQRFSLFPVLAAGFWAFMLLWLWPLPAPPYGLGALVMTSAIVQLVSPWQEPPPPQAKRVRLRYA
jgi:hypothetical protein